MCVLADETDLTLPQPSPGGNRPGDLAASIQPTLPSFSARPPLLALQEADKNDPALSRSRTLRSLPATPCTRPTCWTALSYRHSTRPQSQQPLDPTPTATPLSARRVFSPALFDTALPPSVRRPCTELADRIQDCSRPLCTEPWSRHSATGLAFALPP